jgi:hypothetical protein
MDSDAIAIFLKVFDENRAVSDMTLENQDQNKKVINLGLFVLLILAFCCYFISAVFSIFL